MKTRRTEGSLTSGWAGTESPHRVTAAGKATCAGGARPPSGHPAHGREYRAGVGVPRAAPRPRPSGLAPPLRSGPAARGIVGVVVRAAPRSAAPRRHRRGISAAPARASAAWAGQRPGGGSAARAGGVLASAPSGGGVAPAPAVAPAARVPGRRSEDSKNIT
uniref:Uncharacterized protein n=1 Tax=Molossus molossus TaxID=27622 RepID=A0A7J8BYJ3_MOLMO|nr:hypothetical protein HJG59_010060 [Molossus molossus]